MKTLTEINLEKSRSGVYKDNEENRRLHRVGQRYGEPKKEESSKGASSLPTKGDLESSKDGSSIIVKNDKTRNIVIFYSKRDGKWFSNHSMMTGGIETNPERMLRTLQGYKREPYSIKPDLNVEGGASDMKVSKNKRGVSGVYLYSVKKDGSLYSKPEFHRFFGDEKSAEDVISRLEKQNPGQRFVKDKDSDASPVEEKELKVKVNPDFSVGDTLLDLYSKEDFDTVKNGGHISFWEGGSIVNSIERRDNKWVSKTSSGEKEISSKEVYSLLKKYYDNEKNNKEEGKKLSFHLKVNPKPQSKPQSKPTTESQKKEYIDRVHKMSDDELAHIALGYSAEKYAKANAAYEKAKAAFKKKWGDGISGMVDRISSMKDVEELLKDSQELGKKLTDAQTSSPYTPETIQALKRRVINQLKKGVSIDNVEVRNFAVQHQRSYWNEGDFTSRQGEFLANALKRDAAALPAKGDMGDLYWTESTLEKYFDKKLSAKEFNKLVNMVAEQQGRKPNRMRGESTIGGYEDFKRVMSNLDTEDGQPKDKKPEVQQGKENFTRVNFADMPNAHRVNLKKYLSAKRKAVVDKQFEQVERSVKKGTDFSEALKGMIEKFNNDFEGMSKAERAERLYAVMRMKNILEKK